MEGGRWMSKQWKDPPVKNTMARSGDTDRGDFKTLLRAGGIGADISRQVTGSLVPALL